MSTSLYWQPVNKQTLCDGCSSIARVLSETFGDFPLTLTGEDRDKLLGMQAVYEHEPNPYEVLTDAIAEFGSVFVDVQS